MEHPVARGLDPVGLRSSPKSAIELFLKNRDSFIGAQLQPSGSKLPRHIFQ